MTVAYFAGLVYVSWKVKNVSNRKFNWKKINLSLTLNLIKLISLCPALNMAKVKSRFNFVEYLLKIESSLARVLRR